MQKQHFLDFLSCLFSLALPFFFFFDRTDFLDESELDSDRAGEYDRERDSDIGIVTDVGLDEHDVFFDEAVDEKYVDSLSSLFFFFLIGDEVMNGGGGDVFELDDDEEEPSSSEG